MDLVNLVSGVCWKCTAREFGPDYKKKGDKCTRIFEVTRGVVTRKSPTGITIVDVRDVLKCKECGELVPIDTWRTYQVNGDIVIRKQREIRRGV